VCGVPEVIHDDATGLLVPPGDIGAFTDSINRLLDSPNLRRELGDNAREYIEVNNSMKEVAKKYLNLYKTASNQE
jgi:glycosyltransferase involved in cell wall biosynthesis